MAKISPISAARHGRPPLLVEESEQPPAPLPPLTPVARKELDYSDIEAAMAQADEAIRHARQALARLARGPDAPVAADHPMPALEK